MKKLFVSLFILTACHSFAQDMQQTYTQQPRALVEVFKEKSEQESITKKVRAVERGQHTVLEKFKALYAADKVSIVSKKAFEKVIFGIVALSAIGGSMALVHYLIYADHSSLTLL